MIIPLRKTTRLGVRTMVLLLAIVLIANTTFETQEAYLAKPQLEPEIIVIRRIGLKPDEIPTLEKEFKRESREIDWSAIELHYPEPDYEGPGNYPTAEYVWAFLKKQGFSDTVAAGIVGNMMAEVGGQTLKLNHTLYSSGGGFYGLCQWSSRYYPGIQGADLDSQLNYLMEDIHRQFKTFGHIYKRGFTYEDFCNMTDEREAAYAFAVVYERCSSASHGIRKKNAEKALDYFMNEGASIAVAGPNL